MSRQRWIDLFQGAVREARKPAELGIACSAASFGDVQWSDARFQTSHERFLQASQESHPIPCPLLRLLLNGAIQPFQEDKRVLGFFWTYRQVYPVSRDALRP
jgi:hypothetical protein